MLNKRKKNKNKIIDTWYCLRKYPEIREKINKDVNSYFINFESLSSVVKKEFSKKYPKQECTDPDFDSDYYQSKNDLSFKNFEDAYEHWMIEGREKGYFYNEGKSTAIKIILKTFNEDFYIEEWIKYYENLVGLENIIILDHESDSKKVLDIYERYKNQIIILKINHSTNHDFIHNTEHFSLIYDFLKKNTLFYGVFDTDEFLCAYDGDKITSKDFQEKILEHADSTNIATTWLNSYFTGTDLDRPSESVFFSAHKQSVRHNVLVGKIIIRNSQEKEIVAHNRTMEGVNISPYFFTLHLKRTNLEFRIKSQINACVSFELVNKKNVDDYAKVLEELEKVSDKPFERHSASEVYKYLKDQEAYRKSMTDYDESNLIKTNVISNTIYGDNNFPLEYSLKSKDSSDLKELIRDGYKHAKEHFFHDSYYKE